MKTSCSPNKTMRLFALSLALIGILSFGTLLTFNATFTALRTQSVPSVQTVGAVTTSPTDISHLSFVTHPTFLIADGVETHGDGHGGGHGDGGQETHGGGGGGGGKTHG